VRDVVRGVEKVTDKPLAVRISPRRPGDPPTLIADPSRIQAVLDWKPAHDGLDEIIASAIAWERRFNR
jgi:UDP-glucose 4-epimerase